LTVISFENLVRSARL